MKGRNLAKVVGVTLTFFISVGVNAESSAQLPVSAFSKLPKIQKVRLSPDGGRIAYTHNLTMEGEDLAILQVYDFKKGSTDYLLRSDNEKVKISWYRWVNNTKLAVSALYEVKQRHVKFHKTRMFIMDYTKPDEKLRTIIDVDRLRKTSRLKVNPQYLDSVVDWLDDDPDHIMMQVDTNTVATPSVFKINVNTFHRTRIERAKRKVRDWITDQQSALRLGIARNYDNGETEVIVRENEEADWETLFSYNAMNEKGMYPKGFGLDPNILYYTAYKGDFLALYKMTLDNRKSELVYADDNYDVDGSLIYSPKTGEAIGINHPQAKNGEYYWQPRWAKLQTMLDKALPEFTNTILSFNADETYYILHSEMDGTPPYISLGNTKTNKIDGLFNLYPQLAGQTIPANEKVTYKARDGLEIEAYLTLPVTGKPPYPTVIHPHGGPGARDFDGFNYWIAYFTSRGYAVLRPNFRGSTGYGYEFANAQMKGWGLQMQDDITDATNWMIEKGHADKEKICIVGGSYGGYAALMATVKTPDLFACAISVNGVSDLKYLERNARNFVNHEFVKNQIGDNSDDLEARSPLYHAEKITTPVLLVHGEEDRRVSVRHSRMMAEELEDHDHPAFKYVELEAGDHHLSIQRNRHRFFAEMDAFLNQYLH
ncbi:alpha/beta hydrolase family protein [Salinimonas iocasae]|uniref:S9 family peptidase n=1 Tax=Salinimonas iocasae TaxID=2572577 RepID=A0A5B7YHE3_9ALTE|nr:alpha/beta fold hydrolase [Salinimonas iocasae]QCZ95054.1 S9 family peptidase [Salinimonas iocasae]